jgi:hypothetical protein
VFGRKTLKAAPEAAGALATAVAARLVDAALLVETGATEVVDATTCEAMVWLSVVPAGVDVTGCAAAPVPPQAVNSALPESAPKARPRSRRRLVENCPVATLGTSLRSNDAPEIKDAGQVLHRL